MKRRPTDTEMLDWLITGSRVWKSSNKGYFARGKGQPVFGGTHYGVLARDAIAAAMAAERRAR